LTTDQVVALSTAQVASLTTQQIVALSTRQVGTLETRDIAALSTSQVAALTTDQFRALTTAQVSSLGTSQVASLETQDLASLSTAQVAAIPTAGIAALRTDEVVALTTAQVAALGTAQIRALSTAGMAALETQDLKMLGSAQLVALTSAQILSLTTDQLCALSTAQLSALSASSASASLSTGQLAAIRSATPLVLDLNGDGVRTLALSKGVQFDLLATGQPVQTGWVSSADGLLAMDRNGDGMINDGGELFGSSTRLADGARASDGYAALGALDSNGDGVISPNDRAFADLRVWVDANSDGVSAASEIRSLAELGIAQIGLAPVAGLGLDHGNLLGLTSSYQTTDGKTHDAADVWFAVGEVPTDAAHASSLSETDETGERGGLDSRVSSLKDAITGFDRDGFEASDALPGGKLARLPQGLQALGQPPLSVSQMVAVLHQYDNDGGLAMPPHPLGYAAPPALGRPRPHRRVAARAVRAAGGGRLSSRRSAAVFECLVVVGSLWWARGGV